MPLPNIFATAPATPPLNLAALDANFNAVGACTIVPCTVSGTNSLTLTPLANTPTAAYANYSGWGGIAANSNSGATTAAIGTLARLNVYKDTGAGPAALSGSEIIAGNYFALFYDSTLNSGAGGFHLITTTTQTLASIANNRVLANISGGSAAPSANTVTAVLDSVFSNTQGAILNRGASLWAASNETSWTPALTFGGASVGVTYGTQVGQYMAIGWLAIGLFNIVLTSKGSSTGTATLSLPVTAGGGNRTGSLIISNYTSLAAGDTGGLFGGIAAAGTTASLYKTGGAGTVTALADTDFTNTSALSGFFLVFTG